MTSPLRAWNARWALPFAALLAACGGGGGRPGLAPPEGSAAVRPDDPLCPATAEAPRPLPGVAEDRRSAAYWFARTAEVADLDAPVLTPMAVRAQNAALGAPRDDGLPTDPGSLAQAPPLARLRAELEARLTYLREKVGAGEYVGADGRPFGEGAVDLSLAPLRPQPELRVALGPVPLRCGPRRGGMYKTPVDPAFDRNNCSMIRPQEPVQVLQRWPGGMLLARTRYSLGWIAADAPLSPPVDGAARVAWLGAGRVEVLEPGSSPGRPAGDGAGRALSLPLVEGGRADLAPGTFLPVAEDGTVFVADRAGAQPVAPSPRLVPTARALTRRGFLLEVFRHLDRPYGWGGEGGGVDCSRLVMDTLASFGLALPRHSARQAESGTHRIDLRDVRDLAERQRLLDAAHRQGIVLLHFPGHIMVYLGRDEAGTPMAIHAFAEYAEACPEERGETLRQVRRVDVSDLSLGAGSSRGSFLERATVLVLFAPAAGPALQGLAAPRPALDPVMPDPEACVDSVQRRVFHSPERPNATQPLRVLVTSTEEPGPVTLQLEDADGVRHRPEVMRLGGPPFTYVAEVSAPTPGRWTVLLGDGPHVAACEHVRVWPRRPGRLPLEPTAIWTPRWRWEDDTETLFSAFVERLFDFPMEGEDRDRTWTSLDTLLQDPSHNLLYDHLSQREESRIHLVPDCADLPYFLRTYFAWKLRLPFGYRSCTRGRWGRPPVCTELRTPRVDHEHVDAVDAFHEFIRRDVKSTVHSASGRTLPTDPETPLYPLPLTREALRPGVVFADPYGHLLVVAKWIPQGLADEGILVGADAQPDGTVGRRRFWRGSFLFHPDTTQVGAGFKGWRPVLYDHREEAYASLPNREITARRGYVPFSLEQYEGTTDAFYDRMDALINPRTLDVAAVQRSLVDALEEAVARRVVSVDNGEAWIASHPGRTMEMPDGGAIFETGGPWEEFSTPSRDMRLLIAIDTVAGLPDAVRRRPDRFGVRAAEVAAAVERAHAAQRRPQAERTFSYRRSDGQAQSLTLADLVARADALEVAYNPNDCIEIRWGAPEGGPERASCRRRAPPEQRAKMAEYREWFRTRRRPVY
ncbi:MAG: NlpC/P60 family protein [Sandaracinaceae bacterium]